MGYNFYDELSEEEKKRYNLMILANYILLRCDEWEFIETDENNRESISVSWIQSIQPTLQLFGLAQDAYPQGSVSANRNYYEALNNVLGLEFKADKEYENLRRGLRNFIRLRCDDSGPFKSYLFGSFYKVEKQSGIRDPYNYRHINVSLRHSATALWIYSQELKENQNQLLKTSLLSFYDRIKQYLNKNEEWERDHFKHLTLSSTINLCKILNENNSDKEILELSGEVKEQCTSLILSEDCMMETLDGEYKWRIPSPSEHKMAYYEYYLNAFTLTQIPELLNHPFIISIMKGMLRNEVKTNYGNGIPINSYQISNGNIKADFGTSASMLYLIWYSLENIELTNEWRNLCTERFKTLLRFCLNVFDKIEYYILPHSENHSKVLFLPNFLKKEEIKNSKQIIDNVKKCIKMEIEQRNNKLSKNLMKIDLPKELYYIRELIDIWEIPKYWEKQKRWSIENSIGWGKAGEFFGGILKSLTS